MNSIGARIEKNLICKCKSVTENTKNLRIFKFKCDLDGFLELDEESRNNYIKELHEKVIKELLKIKGIGLSKATKILHTLYPEIIPIIDSALQREYKQIKREWAEEQSDQILIDYYNNFKVGDTKQNLIGIFNQIHSNIKGLTRVRIFDILWWSYLKSKKLRQEKGTNWSTIKY